VAAARERQHPTTRRLLAEALGEHGGRRRAEARLELAGAHADAQYARVVDGERRRVERLLAAVGEREQDALTVEARRARDERRVVDVDIREATGVEAQDDAPVGLGVEPAEERAAQPLVPHLLALVDEAPLAIDADPRAAQPLEVGRVGRHRLGR